MCLGIGRTGTFCTLDIAIRKFAATEKIDIRSTGTCIRSKGVYGTNTLLYLVNWCVYPVKRCVPIHRFIWSAGACIRSKGVYRYTALSGQQVRVSGRNILLYPVYSYVYPVKNYILIHYCMRYEYLVGQYVPIHCCTRCTATCIWLKKYERNYCLFLWVHVSGWKIRTGTDILLYPFYKYGTCI
jgi:hypothetical protein